MIFYSPRSETIAAIVTALGAVSSLKLVKPYEGEFWRLYLKSQIKAETFPAEVNLTAPFALVSSRTRPVEKQNNKLLGLRHDLSILVGIQNRHDFTSTSVSSIFDILEEIARTIVGARFHEHAGELQMENDGVFLAKTDNFIVYEQQYFQLEKATL